MDKESRDGKNGREGEENQNNVIITIMTDGLTTQLTIEGEIYCLRCLMHNKSVTKCNQKL